MADQETDVEPQEITFKVDVLLLKEIESADSLIKTIRISQKLLLGLGVGCRNKIQPRC